MMIYLIIGGSCSGKTSFAFNSFIKGKDFEQKKDILDYCETNDTILLGKWNSETRTKGSDTIGRSHIPLIDKQIIKFLNETKKDIVLEGDKITSRTIFNLIKELKVACKLYWVRVEPEISYERNVKNGSRCSFAHLKSVVSKAQNIFYEYCDIFDGEIVDTNFLNREDFNRIDKDNYMDLLRNKSKKEKKPMRNDFAIFILSHGRAKTMKTLQTIKNCGYKGRWYIVCDNEDNTINEYYDLYGKENVIVFNKLVMNEKCDTMDIKSRKRNVILFARNVCFEIAQSLGLNYFLELDDDYIEFRERYEKNGTLSSRFVLDFDSICEEMIEFLDMSGALTIAFAQMGDFIGGLDCAMFKQRITRKCMNSFFCKVDRPFQFIGRINEDVNTYCLLGTQGKLLFTISDIALNQVDTQQGNNGMTTTYLDGGTYVKSFYSVIACPSCVQIAEMGVNHKRFHHLVDWEHCLPKILSDKYRKE